MQCSSLKRQKIDDNFPFGLHVLWIPDLVRHRDTAQEPATQAERRVPPLTASLSTPPC